MSFENLEVEISSESPEITTDLDELRYLVFQGKKGDKGDKGDTGPQGPAGSPGSSPLVVKYIVSTGQFNSSYDDILDAYNAGREIYCDISCGASVFRARMQRFCDSQDDSFFSFDYQTWNGPTQKMWWGRLAVYDDDTVYYHEGDFTVSQTN